MFYNYFSTDIITLDEMCRSKNTGLNMQTTLGLKKQDDKWVYCLDLPGVKKKDVDIEIEEKNLLVGWSRNNKTYCNTVSLIGYMSYIDLDSCDAVLEDGVLTVTFNSSKETQKKKIVVK
jgi:HSP20 family molecular chaperone IbpA